MQKVCKKNFSQQKKNGRSRVSRISFIDSRTERIDDGNRVTLGDSPQIRQFFYFGVIFLKITEVVQILRLLFYTVTVIMYVLISRKMCWATYI
jgi:hypothetical protein